MEAKEHGLAVERIFAGWIFVGDARVLDFSWNSMNGTYGCEKVHKMPLCGQKLRIIDGAVVRIGPLLLLELNWANSRRRRCWRRPRFDGTHILKWFRASTDIIHLLIVLARRSLQGRHWILLAWGFGWRQVLRLGLFMVYDHIDVLRFILRIENWLLFILLCRECSIIPTFVAKKFSVNLRTHNLQQNVCRSSFCDLLVGAEAFGNNFIIHDNLCQKPHLWIFLPLFLKHSIGKILCLKI